MALSGCAAKSPQVVSAPPVYQGLPDALLARCTVQAVNEVVTGDIIINRIRYKAAFEKCAAQVDAIRAHDQNAREILK